MQKKLLIFAMCIFTYMQAQQIHEKCANTHYMDYLEQTYPGFKQAVEATFQQAKTYSQNKNQLKSTNANTPDTIYRIPVVFHVVYNTPQENLSEAILLDQLAVMNEDFRRLNADTTNTRALFKDRAADVGFEFFLATIDPNGNPTTGITRTQTSVTSFNTGFFDLNEMDNAKRTANGGIDAWDVSTYMNIWISNLESPLFGDGLLGYSYPPIAAANWPAGSTPIDSTMWGLNIHYKVVGRNNPNLPASLAAFSGEGRTVTHEAGHFWGLRHIWGDAGGGFGGGTDCDITKDDGFSDTPHMGSNSQAEGCSFTKNTCTNGESPDEPDMVENYMDYSTEACQNMFTEQQANLMQSMAVIGRPNLPHIIKDETISVGISDWVVVNGTDTFQITASTVIELEDGDEVMFLNENNGYNYTVVNSGTYTGSFQADVTKNGTIEFEATSIKDLYRHTISIYPNPTKGQVVCSKLLSNNIKSITVYNILGETLEKLTISGVDQTNINFSRYNEGVYIVAFENNEQVKFFKKIQYTK